MSISLLISSSQFIVAGNKHSKPADMDLEGRRTGRAYAFTAWEVLLEALPLDPGKWIEWHTIPPFNPRCEEERLSQLYDFGRGTLWILIKVHHQE